MMTDEQQQNRMLMLDGILDFLSVSQKVIDESVFERRRGFECKEDYNFRDYIPTILYEVKKIQSPVLVQMRREERDYKKKTLFQPNRSLFSEEEEPIKPQIKKEERLERPIKEIDIYKPIPTSFEKIFGGDYLEYRWIEVRRRNKWNVFTFISSLLMMMDEFFYLKKDDEKEMIIKDLLKKMHSEIFLEENYRKFYYYRNRRFKKEFIQTTMNKSLTMRVEDEMFYIVQQYIADYFGVNIFIFKIVDGFNIDFDKSEFYGSKQYHGRVNPYLPTFFMMYMNQIYYPIVHKDTDKKSYLLFSNDYDIYLQVWEYMKLDEMHQFFEEEKKKKEEEEEEEKKKDNEDVIEEMERIVYSDECDVPQGEKIKMNFSISASDRRPDEKKEVDKKKYTQQELKNMKLEELQSICKEFGIDIQKKSEKTIKMLNRTKQELIDDILIH